MSRTETPGGEVAEALAADFTGMARSLFSAGGVDATLARVVELAVNEVEGCDFAGIFLVDEGTVTAPVHSHPVAAEVDDLQNRAAEGPCLDAIAHNSVFYADDLAEDTRWPTFGPEAEARGMRSLLALPLLTNGSLGALNLYAGYPQAFGVVDRGRGLLLAAMAGLAIAAAQSHEDDGRRVDNLNTALASRELIGQAQGILMERERITGEQAFDILRRASQHLNRKLREVAQDLIETGVRPDTGSPS